MAYNTRMPELPEVETVRKQLEPILVGKSITNFSVIHPRQIIGNPKSIINQKIIAVNRRAKVLIIEPANGYKILIHPKMTGRIIVHNRREPLILPSHPLTSEGNNSSYQGLPNKHTHAIISLNDKTIIFYNDVRKFGWLKILAPGEKFPFLDSLGPEPLTENFNVDNFYKSVKKSKKPIKVLIMEGKVVAGVGNIYANEALFCAKINPKKKSNTLSKNQVQRLYLCIKKVLLKGLKYRGSSLASFVDIYGNKGKMQENFLIYNRSAKPCLNSCGNIIKKFVIAGRGTFYCPKCQK